MSIGIKNKKYFFSRYGQTKVLYEAHLSVGVFFAGTVLVWLKGNKYVKKGEYQ